MASTKAVANSTGKRSKISLNWALGHGLFTLGIGRSYSPVIFLACIHNKRVSGHPAPSFSPDTVHSAAVFAGADGEKGAGMVIGAFFFRVDDPSVLLVAALVILVAGAIIASCVCHTSLAGKARVCCFCAVRSTARL